MFFFFQNELESMILPIAQIREEIEVISEITRTQTFMLGQGLRKLAASDQLLGEEPKPLMTRLKWFKEEVMLYNW